MLLPERTTPDLLYLETKWAALMSYGLTVKLLQDVLLLDEPLEAVTIRNHVFKLAQRLEDALATSRSHLLTGVHGLGGLPIPDGPLTVGIDGATVKAQGQQGSFEIIAGRSLLAFHRGKRPKRPSPASVLLCPDL